MERQEWSSITRLTSILPCKPSNRRISDSFMGRCVVFAFLLCVFVAFERNNGVVGYIRRVSALVRRSARGSACKNRNASRLRDPLFLGRLPISLQSGRFWLRIEDYLGVRRQCTHIHSLYTVHVPTVPSCRPP